MENKNNENHLKELSSIKISELDISEVEDVTISLTKNLVILSMCLKTENVTESFKLHALDIIKSLKIACSKGSTLQSMITNTYGFIESAKNIMQCNCDENIKLNMFQLIANLGVQNQKVQKRLWNELNELLLAKFSSEDNRFVNVSAMIIHNMILNSPGLIDDKEVLKESLKQYRRYLSTPPLVVPDFLHVLLEYFICEHPEIDSCYEKLSDNLRVVFLYFIQDHVEDENNRVISAQLLKLLTLEFKKSSDCILKTVSSYVDSLDPNLVVILLHIISAATTHEKYLDALKHDQALFLNLGCLLQALVKLGKKSDNVFTPIQKLDALVPTSSESPNFEKEVSYSFKSKLVKSLANLSYRNKKNQDMAREMEIMPSIFECTNADARNPLIKEWSILAIRNLCEDNHENQKIVRSLTNVGNADNPVLSEFKLDDGVFRINK